jgi:hypothetical protein
MTTFSVEVRLEVRRERSSLVLFLLLLQTAARRTCSGIVATRGPIFHLLVFCNAADIAWRPFFVGLHDDIFRNGVDTMATVLPATARPTAYHGAGATRASAIFRR